MKDPCFLKREHCHLKLDVSIESMDMEVQVHGFERAHSMKDCIFRLSVGSARVGVLFPAECAERGTMTMY